MAKSEQDRVQEYVKKMEDVARELGSVHPLGRYVLNEITFARSFPAEMSYRMSVCELAKSFVEDYSEQDDYLKDRFRAIDIDKQDFDKYGIYGCHDDTTFDKMNAIVQDNVNRTLASEERFMKDALNAPAGSNMITFSKEVLETYRHNLDMIKEFRPGCHTQVYLQKTLNNDPYAMEQFKANYPDINTEKLCPETASALSICLHASRYGLEVKDMPANDIRTQSIVTRAMYNKSEERKEAEMAEKLAKAKTGKSESREDVETPEEVSPQVNISPNFN